MEKKKCFMVVYHQGGGGCDYTIGCGKRVTKFYASSMDEAKELVLERRLS